jgi:TonB-linked SusC/RagA family outer membrane protein
MQALFKKVLIGVTLLTFFITNAYSQDSRMVTGKIQTTTGQGIAGATVKTLPSNKTTLTDSLGYFKINVSKGDISVQVSSLGFLAQTYTLRNESNFFLALQEDTKALTDVVVTAYGIKRETKKIGYSVQEIKGSDLIKARDANPINSLAGKIAGLTVGASAEMLGRPELVLRGSKDLLFVVDGVPVNTDTWNISPDDIETYTVLKGTNASALYGFRGLNGAIVITTKRGSKDKKGWQVDLNSSTMFESGFLALPQSQAEYGRGTNYAYSYGDQLYDNKQRLPEWGPRFEGQLVKQYNSPFDIVTGIRTATPWTAKGANNFENFMQTGVINTNNISMSGATEKSDVRISVSNMDQKGMAPNTKLNSYNLAVNGGYNITKSFRLEASLNFNKQYSPNIPDVNYGPNSYIYMFKVYGAADYDVRDLQDIYKGPQGVQNLIPYAQEYGRENSAWFMAKKWLRSHDKTDVNGYIKASYKVNSDLSLNLRSQFSTWSQLRTEQVPAGANLNTYTPWFYFGWYGDYHEDSRRLTENNTDLTANYDKKVGEFGISALAGISERSFAYNSFWGTTKALAVPNLYVMSNTKDAALSYTWNSRMQVYSAFYSVDLSLSKYATLSHTGRVDQLSTLPDGNNTFFYPSISLSSALKDYLNIPSFISFAKVRGSFADVKGGLTQSTIPSAFTAITGSSTNGGLLGYGSDLYSSYDGPSYANQNAYAFQSYYNGTPSVGYSNTIANKNLKPFNRTSYEGGVDLKFAKNRLGFDFTYFTSFNGPQIYALPVASSTGYTAQNVNGITSKKVGFEITLSGTPIKTANFNWDINATYATYKETLDAIYGTETGLALNNHIFKVGDRLDAIYSSGFVRDGSNNIVWSGGTPLRAPSDITNNKFLGFANPDYTFGISNKFSFKNVSFGFQFDGRIGGSIYDGIYHDGMNGGTSLESAQGAIGAARLAEWQTTATGTVAQTAKYIGPGVKIISGSPKFANGAITNLSELTFAQNDVAAKAQTIAGGSGYGGVDEYWMTSRSFIKLREVNIAYSLPANILAKSKFIKGATFSLVGRNLLYFAQRMDQDLDQFAAGFNDSDRSLQKGGPLQSATARRFGFNINLNF